MTLQTRLTSNLLRHYPKDPAWRRRLKAALYRSAERTRPRT